MPTLEHDGVVGLFRDNPQREIKDRKKYSWPVYVAVPCSERECPAILLVVAVDEHVADWAAQPIDLGASRGSVQPVVLGPQTIPEITDEQVARQEVELALLSGMAHGNGTNGNDIISAAIVGMETLDQEARMVYFQMLWNVLREPMQVALERLVMEQQSTRREFPFVKELGKYIYREAEAKGFRDGEVKAVRENIFRLAQRRGFVLSDEQQERLRTCDDRQVLDRWFDDVIDAQNADDLFR